MWHEQRRHGAILLIAREELVAFAHLRPYLWRRTVGSLKKKKTLLIDELLVEIVSTFPFHISRKPHSAGFTHHLVLMALHAHRSFAFNASKRPSHRCLGLQNNKFALNPEQSNLKNNAVNYSRARSPPSCCFCTASPCRAHLNSCFCAARKNSCACHTFELPSSTSYCSLA